MNTRIHRVFALGVATTATIAGLGLAAAPLADATELAAERAAHAESLPSTSTCVQFLIDRLVPASCDIPSSIAVYRVVERGVVSEASCPIEADYVYTSGGGVDIYGPVTCLQKVMH